MKSVHLNFFPQTKNGVDTIENIILFQDIDSTFNSLTAR